MKNIIFKSISPFLKYFRSGIKYQIIVLFLLSAGCSNRLFPDNYIPLNSLENYNEVSADSVEVYVAQLPLRQFKEIGIFYFATMGNPYRPKNIPENIIKAKRIAAQHGANAVIRLDVTDFNIKGVAVRWK